MADEESPGPENGPEITLTTTGRIMSGEKKNSSKPHMSCASQWTLIWCCYQFMYNKHLIPLLTVSWSYIVCIMKFACVAKDWYLGAFVSPMIFKCWPAGEISHDSSTNTHAWQSSPMHVPSGD